jgi:hypothetical protein
MLNLDFRSTLLVTLCLVPLPLPPASPRQLTTIPEQLARAGSSLMSGPTIPSGPAPSLDSVLLRTDIIVRGEVGDPRSYLSEDQTDVLTDYPIRNPVILYSREGSSGVVPGRSTAITVTILGGTVSINGLTFTSQHAALPTLESGAEGLFCLERVGRHNLIAHTYYGAFRVEAQSLVPLTAKKAFAPEMQRESAAKAIADLVARIRMLRQTVR